jgi:replicative DNA helicase
MTIDTCAQLESALVGSLLVAPEKILSIADKIKVTDFTDQRAQLTYTAIFSLWQQKKAVDITSVISSNPNLPLSFLSSAINTAYPPGIQNYAFEISERARSRRIKTGLEASVKSTGSPDDILAGVMAMYKSEMAVGKKSPDVKSVLSRVEKLISKNREKGKIGFATGFNTLEKLYMRYIPGHIWTIGGFTSVGKTAIMVQKICNLISLGEDPAILVVSTEMTEEQVISRIVSNFTGVHSMRILTGNYHSEEEFEAVATVKNNLQSVKLTIYDDIYRLEEIETAFRKADLQGGVNVGFIDYVQNCKWPDAKSQYQEQSEIAKRFQVLAKDVRATLICLSQVSNDVGRGNTDQLELKGAGEWAAVSDIGIMLTRHKTEKYRLKYMIKKNRHGALAERELEFKHDFTRIEERPE